MLTRSSVMILNPMRCAGTQCMCWHCFDLKLLKNRFFLVKKMRNSGNYIDLICMLNCSSERILNSSRCNGSFGKSVLVSSERSGRSSY